MVRLPAMEADIVVVTALDLEYDAVRAHLTDPRPHTDRHGTRYEIGRLRMGACRIALALIGEGNLAAAALTGRAIEEFRPRALLLVGVAGALGRDTALGDVVVATRTHAYQGGRDDAGGFHPRPKSWPAPHGIEQIARHVARTGAWINLSPVPTVHFKPLVSGEVILDSRTSALAALIAHYYSDAIAIDTESAGVAEAAHRRDFHRVVVVRAISDAADGRKHHTDIARWQHRAAAHAASFAMTLAEQIDQQWPKPPPLDSQSLSYRLSAPASGTPRSV